MVLTQSAWYNEPGIKFRISFRVFKAIRQLLIDEIMEPYGLVTKDPDIYIGLVTATSKKTKDLEVRGPEYDKRNKFINYGLWLPYEKIENSVNYTEMFLNYYFDALVIVFNNYSVPESSIRNIQNKTKLEVLDNELYAYNE